MILFEKSINYYLVLPHVKYPVSKVIHLLIFSFIIQTTYYVFAFRRLATYPHPTPNPDEKDNIPNNSPAISLIVCARNEAENLRLNLPVWATQEHPNYELIVVDDASDDETPLVLQDFCAIYPHLRIVSVGANEQRTATGKKHALAKGIEHAHHDILLLTDADCQPASPLWLQTMTRHYTTPTTEIVLGYAPYKTNPPYLLNKLVQFETFYTALQYLSFALCRMPYMGVGRNLSYRKSLYKKVQGFEAHKHILSGDDDLFISRVANSHNTKIELNPITYCFSQAPNSWGAWYRQKKRHLSSATKYRNSIKTSLFLLSATHLAFYGTLLVVILSGTISGIAIATFLFLLRIFVQVLIIRPALRLLKTPLSTAWYALFDILFIVYYLLFLPSLRQKKITWK